MGKINMDRKYARQTAFYPTRPNPFDARINSGENHKIQCSVNRKTEKQLYFHSYFRAVDDQANELQYG